MGKKMKAKKLINSQQDHKVFEGQNADKNNTLILGGLLLAFSSIALLVFVLSEKVFDLS